MFTNTEKYFSRPLYYIRYISKFTQLGKVSENRKGSYLNNHNIRLEHTKSKWISFRQVFIHDPNEADEFITKASCGFLERPFQKTRRTCATFPQFDKLPMQPNLVKTKTENPRRRPPSKRLGRNTSRCKLVYVIIKVKLTSKRHRSSATWHELTEFSPSHF